MEGSGSWYGGSGRGFIAVSTSNDYEGYLDTIYYVSSKRPAGSKKANLLCVIQATHFLGFLDFFAASGH